MIQTVCLSGNTSGVSSDSLQIGVWGSRESRGRTPAWETTAAQRG